MTGQVKRKQRALVYRDMQGVRLKVRRHFVTILRWLVLLELAYVFLFPVLFMLSTSFKPLIELSNPTVRWIPRNPTADGYVLALEHLNYFRSLPVSIVTSAIAAMGTDAGGRGGGIRLCPIAISRASASLRRVAVHHNRAPTDGHDSAIHALFQAELDEYLSAAARPNLPGLRGSRWYSARCLPPVFQRVAL